MTETRNPYAPPKSMSGGGFTEPKGLWREGKDLIAVLDEHFPARCIKCNAPAEPRDKPLRLWWHKSWVYVLILISVPIYVIVALIVRKQAKVTPALCANHKKRRRNALLAGWLGTLLCIVAGFAAATNDRGALALIAFLCAFGFIIGGMIGARILYARKIDNVFVRLRGCGEPFLDSLPPFSERPYP